jgi:predicted lipoprotein with Yx(FWY)xxD motif
MNQLVSSKRASLMLKVGGPLAAAAVLAAACSSGGSSSSSSSAPAPSTPAAGNNSSSSAVDVHSGDGTSFLTDRAGRSLYMFGSDTSTNSTCSGACATAWPPLTTKGPPTAGAGATASDLGTITRSDGSKQVTYAGHPLYSFARDTSAGQTNGEGKTAFGAPWYLVAPSGQRITSLNAASAPSASAPAPAPPPAPARPAPQRSTANPIPQDNGGDHDQDNNGGPSDGDGNI